MPAEAAKRGPTALERKAAYQEELLVSVVGWYTAHSYDRLRLSGGDTHSL
jgi:hypothetical protein